MVTSARFRELALAFAEASEVPHMERLAYRTPRRIFATIGPDGDTANLLLTPELQAAIVGTLPGVFYPVPGGWGRMGYTTVELRKVKQSDLVRVLTAAHGLASGPARKKTKKAAKKKAKR